jgi:hypothetical protein
MIIQSFFGEAQTGLGYQFYSDAGALLGTRVTAGVAALPEPGAYTATASVPAGAVGVYWSSDTATASEDLREALAFSPATLAALESAEQILLGSLYVPTVTPSLIIPIPADDPALCRVYLYTEDMTGLVTPGIEIKFELSAGPLKSERVISRKSRTLTTNLEGYAEIDLQRTDALIPNDVVYLVTSDALGLNKVPMTLAADLYDLKTLIT